MAALRYQDKTVIVTGGSRGIGEGITRVFYNAGANVVFCSNDPTDGLKLEEVFKGQGGPGQATFIKCDVSVEEDIINLVTQTIEKYHRIDCIVNNAGTHPDHRPIDQFPSDEMRKLFNINFMGCYMLSQQALPHLRKTQGNIINISSLVGVFGQPGAVTYAATKGAMTAFTKALAIDESEHGVRVNSVSPGNIWTPLWAMNAAEMDDPITAITGGCEAQLIGRMGTTEEAGKLCLFIAAEATFQTGVDFLLTGGAELSYGKKTRVPAVLPKETFGQKLDL